MYQPCFVLTLVLTMASLPTRSNQTLFFEVNFPVSSGIPMIGVLHQAILEAFKNPSRGWVRKPTAGTPKLVGIPHCETNPDDMQK